MACALRGDKALFDRFERVGLFVEMIEHAFGDREEGSTQGQFAVFFLAADFAASRSTRTSWMLNTPFAQHVDKNNMRNNVQYL